MLIGEISRRKIPHEPEDWIEFRQLSGPEMDAAEERRSISRMAFVEDIPEETIARFRRTRDADSTPEEERESDPALRYDRKTLLRSAIVDWSYSDPLTPDNIERLDPVTWEWAIGVVLEMNTRPLASIGSIAGNSNGTSSPLPSSASIEQSPQE